MSRTAKFSDKGIGTENTGVPEGKKAAEFY